MKRLLEADQLQAGVTQMAAEINEAYGGQPLTIVGVMTGSVMLLADLIRQLDMPLRVGVVQASSYRGATSRGPLVINSDLMPDIAKQDVLIVDDIFDTGHTMVELISLMEKLGLNPDNCTIVSVDAVDFYPSVKFKLVKKYLYQ